MSDIKFNCPQCGQLLAVDATGAGLTVACPKCNQAIIVPQLAQLAKPERLARGKWWWLAAGMAALALVAGLLIWQNPWRRTTAAGPVSASLADHAVSPKSPGNPQATKDSNPAIPSATTTALPEPVPVRSDYLVGAYYWISWNTNKVLANFMDWRDSMFQPLLGQ
jgi:hypothetical protein